MRIHRVSNESNQGVQKCGYNQCVVFYFDSLMKVNTQTQLRQNRCSVLVVVSGFLVRRDLTVAGRVLVNRKGVLTHELVRVPKRCVEFRRSLFI